MVGRRGYEVFVLSAPSATTDMRKISSTKREWCEICDYEIEGEPYRGVGGKVVTHRLCYDICWAGRWPKTSARKLLDRAKIVKA